MCSVQVFDCKLNADLNKKVFNLDLKIVKEGLSGITHGKLFHCPLFSLMVLSYFSQDIKLLTLFTNPIY